MPRWIRIRHEEKTRFGWLDGNDIQLCHGDMFGNAEVTGESVPLASASILPPVEPRQFLGLWNNLEQRRIAEKNFIPKFPLWFVKLPTCVIADGEEITRPPSFNGKVKFEAELGVVIGKQCFDVAVENIDEYIFGYTCVNDVTAPETLFEEEGFTHWCRAKSYRSFGPIGPVIATDVDPDALRVRGILDGEARQDYPVSDMIFGPREIVSMISREVTLLPGDVIACGTSLGASDMAPGQVIEIVIDGIGALRNRYSG
ncbi:MAG: fumarylacetoacetate hydrolase family protein [Gammaproteobacteria bacterium]|jgi:2-keto-4-pentenoate hydratase/2-oxohepta-3-ene-1,7-dioic acid hydratase in catechol pathway